MAWGRASMGGNAPGEDKKSGANGTANGNGGGGGGAEERRVNVLATGSVDQTIKVSAASGTSLNGQGL
jgi:hypothetical protein